MSSVVDLNSRTDVGKSQVLCLPFLSLLALLQLCYRGKLIFAFLLLRSSVQLPQLLVFYSVIGFVFKLVAETL